ncbi:MAG: response regulator transcription factor [Leptonema sp. (in: bacteria)]
MNKKFSILIVDDIESIRVAIFDFLKTDYNVFVAENGKEAIEILSRSPIDMILSDVRMPDMDGLTLIRKVQKEFPKVRYALITAYNVNDYIAYARKYKIWNIIPKTSFLDLEFIRTMIYKLLTDDIFGFHQYFKDIRICSAKLSEIYKLYKNNVSYFPEKTLYELKIQSEEEREKVADLAYQLLLKQNAPKILRIIIEELTLNARDYGSMNYLIPFQFSFGIYENKFLIGVKDYRGILNFNEVLYRLERNVTFDKDGLPFSINDEHGRGLFIVRENLDHLIVNIEENRETEILGILESDNQFRNKTISMYKIKRKL